MLLFPFNCQEYSNLVRAPLEDGEGRLLCGHLTTSDKVNFEVLLGLVAQQRIEILLMDGVPPAGFEQIKL